MLCLPLVLVDLAETDQGLPAMLTSFVIFGLKSISLSCIDKVMQGIN